MPACPPSLAFSSPCRPPLAAVVVALIHLLGLPRTLVESLFKLVHTQAELIALSKHGTIWDAGVEVATFTGDPRGNMQVCQPVATLNHAPIVTSTMNSAEEVLICLHLDGWQTQFNHLCAPTGPHMSHAIVLLLCLLCFVFGEHTLTKLLVNKGHDLIF